MPNTDVVVPRLPIVGDSISESTELGRRILAGCNKAAKDILDVANLCVQAHHRFKSRGLDWVLSAAAMDKASFFKFVRIGRDARLLPIQDRLPPSMTTIYEVTQFDDQMLEQAVQADLIRPDVRRADILALRKLSGAINEASKERATVIQVVKVGQRYQLSVPESASDARIEEIKKLFERLQLRCGVDINLVEKTVEEPVGS